MLRAAADFFQILPGFSRKALIPQRQAVQADDRVHRRPDLMAHIGQKRCFGLVGLFRRGQRLRERLVLFHGVPHLRVDHGQPQPDGVHDMVVPVFRVPHAGHPDHLVVFLSAPLRQIAVGDDQVILQRLAHIIRINKLQESFPVSFRNSVMRVPGKALQVREVDTLRRLLRIRRVRPVAHRVVLVQVDVINAAVIRCQRGNHPVLLLPAALLFQKLFLQSKPVLQFLLFGPLALRQLRARLFQLDPGGLLGLERPLRAPSVAHEEENDERRDEQDEASEQPHMLPEYVSE